jgi:hypothetical protein
MASTLKTLGLVALFCAVWLAGSPRALAGTEDQSRRSPSIPSTHRSPSGPSIANVSQADLC